MRTAHELRAKVLEALTTLAVRLAEDLPRRGLPVAAELERRGDAAGLAWCRSGELPEDPLEARALFPRLWFAYNFLEHARVHRTPLPTGPSVAVLAEELTTTLWHRAGVREWEKAPGSVPPAG